MKPTTTAVGEPSVGASDGTMELAGILFALLNAEVAYRESRRGFPSAEKYAATRDAVATARAAFSDQLTALIDARVEAGIAALVTERFGLHR